MQVYMLKDVERIGIAGSIITVSEGYATNFLIPKKLAVEITPSNMEFFKQKKVKEKVAVEVLNSKVAMIAEHLKTLRLSIKERVHDNGKLYGSIGADEVVELLKAKGVVVDRKQVEFPMPIKVVGEHKVTIRLSAKHQPQVTLNVEALKQAV
jgi:large subunit ribosomal protein L9